MSATPSLSQIAREAIRHYLIENLQMAHSIAQKYGINYAEIVAKAVTMAVKKTEREMTEYDVLIYDHCRQIFDSLYSNDQKYFLRQLVHVLYFVPKENLSYVLSEFPELFKIDRLTVLDILAFYAGGVDSICDELEEKGIKDIREQVYKHFCLYWQKNYHGEKLSEHEIGRRIHVLANGTVRDGSLFPADAWHHYLIYLVDQYQDEIVINTVVSPIFKAEKSPQIYIEAIKRLMSQGYFSEAAKLAKIIGIRELAIQAAQAAYQRCFSNNQFMEAAGIVIEYRIVDMFGAAEKALEKKLERCDTYGEQSRALEFALSFQLKIPPTKAKEFNPSNFPPSDLLKAGLTELARQSVIHMLDRCYFSGCYGYEIGFIDEFFFEGNPYFSEEETIRLIAKRLSEVAVDEKIIINLLEKSKVIDSNRLKKIAKRFLIEKILVGTTQENIAQMILIFPQNIRLYLVPSDLAEVAAEEALVEHDWEKYKQIAEEWLPGTAQTILEIEG